MVKEQKFYKGIEKFLKEYYRCFVTRKSTGMRPIGRADVIGVRDMGGKTSPDTELIAVEVKIGTGNFCKSLGQALGYSLFAHKCFLAVPFESRNTFTLEQKEFATRLGVGLIVCNKDTRTVRQEIVTSRRFEPLPALYIQVLWNLDYGVCSICGNTFDVATTKETKSLQKVTKEGRALYIRHDLIDSKKPRELLFTSAKMKRKYSNVCRTCLERLGLHQRRS